MRANYYDALGHAVHGVDMGKFQTPDSFPCRACWERLTTGDFCESCRAVAAQAISGDDDAIDALAGRLVGR